MELDLIIERPGIAEVLIEIKSKDYFDADDARGLHAFGSAFKHKEMFVFNNCKTSSVVNGVHFIHWQDGFKKIF
jgi:hypothetical protein